MENNVVEVSSSWRGGLAFDGIGPDDVRVTMDSIVPNRRGPTPMELVLLALAGCTGMDVISILEKKRQPARSLEIRVRGKRSAEHPKVYVDIELEYVFTGENLTPEAAARAIELSMTKYCSVGGMLEKTAPIRTTFRIDPISETPA
jgi:putative redox protein